MIRKKVNNSLFSMIRFALLSTVFFSLYNLAIFSWHIIHAEQTESSPESGADSRIRMTYEDFRQRDLGYDTIGDWGDMGPLNNRIFSGAASAINYPILSQDYYDDCKYGREHGEGESQDEESAWINTATDIWKDTRTGLYWTKNQGEFTNTINANHSLCPYFSDIPRGSSYDGSDPDCGNAINYCSSLELEANAGEGSQNDWYLPTQKELISANMDGIYNQTGEGFVDLDGSWSSTEFSYFNTYVWGANLHDGGVGAGPKTAAASIVCVRRD